MRAFIKQNSFVAFLYLTVFWFALFLILNNDKYELHSKINTVVGNIFFDTFFYFITYLGDGRFLPLLLIPIFLYNVRLGIICTITFLISAGFTTILKYSFFEGVDRPSFVFDWVVKKKLVFVEGLELHIHNSFPSGHATQIFAIFTPIIFFTNKQWVKIAWLALALIASFSRVYLSQHWLNDITFGSLISFVFACLFYTYIVHTKKLNKFNCQLHKLF